MKRAFALAERMEARGTRPAIYSCHTIKPLDKAGLTRIFGAYAHVVVIEECAPSGGLAMQVKRLAWDSDARCRITGFTLQDAFIHVYGSHDDLLDAHGLSVDTLMLEIG